MTSPVDFSYNGGVQKVCFAPLRCQLKARVFCALRESILFYACETWTTTQADFLRLKGGRKRLARREVGVRWHERILTTFLYSHIDCTPVMIEERRLCFIGHVTRFVHTQTS